ncbi:MAG: efflux RND transporter periplasmic adaptor subunit [Gammaproteobacteria bacterium]|nr:efflux RND transporter periplasmic adaptor subunit [Gammaproteobacteria bacterium]
MIIPPFIKNKLITIPAIILIIAMIIFFTHQSKKSPVSIKILPVPVRVSKPIVQSIPLTLSTTGNLTADKSTVITPRASGYIKSIYFHEGETVKAGQILFQLDFQIQKDALSSAKAAEGLSQLQFKRDKNFLKKGYITQDTYYAAQVTLKQNQAALQTAQTNFDQRTITAPFNGSIGAIPVSLGDYVTPGNTLTTLVDNLNLRAEYALPVNALNQLHLNQIASISDSAQKNKISAVVSYISPSIDQSTQTIAVHAKVNNQLQLFKPGEYVTVTQNLGVQNNALLVPEQSVLASINGYSVFTVDDNKAIRTPVKIGDRLNGNVVILSGLKSSDQVIVAGENEVKNNQAVRIR